MLFLCNLWPWLAGAFLGWLLLGWLAKRFKYAEPPIEKIIEKTVEVEKVIDNPKHLSLISKLENENRQIAELKMRIEGYEKSETEIAELIKKEGGSASGGLRSQFTHLVSGFRSKISDHESQEAHVVEKEIIKQVDNPQHIKRIQLLEDQLATWQRGPVVNLTEARSTGIVIKAEDDFTAIEGIGPKINELIHEEGIHTFKELSQVAPARLKGILDDAGSNFKMANPGTWPDQASLAASNRWSALKALQDILDGGVYPDSTAERATTSTSTKDAAKIEALENELNRYRMNVAETASTTDINAAKAAGFRIQQKGNQDDFTVIEGIGPKIDQLIHAEHIHTYNQLAATSTATIQKILDAAGPSFVLAEPDTWPAQAALAAKNQWIDLMRWQDELDGGKE